ncbi:MAG: hypothetical protein JWM95_3607 [Gemmatimonadetes bacterium]|nr:hypothetical protein [Gemmatimonadota bacterium]
MSRIRALIARVLRSGHMEHDLRDELQSHLDMETDEHIRRGMNPAQARRQALLNSGGLTGAAESVRAQRGLPWVDSLLADIRYALRTLRRSTAFTAVVVITLGLGIGANTAIFSVLRGVLLKPLPHRDGDRLLYLRQAYDGLGGENVNFSVPEVNELRSGAKSLGQIAEYSQWTQNLEGPNDAIKLNAGLVSGNFFDAMGLSPILGRLTRPSDDGAGAPPVMVLTNEFWMKRFAGDSSIIGKQVRLGGASVTVIGVVQPAPFFPDHVDAFLNMVVSPHHVSAMMVQGRTHRMTEVLARLAPGATLDMAAADIAALHSRMRQEHPDAYNPASHYRIDVIPFKTAIGEKARLTLWLLMGAAAFVMIISIANVVNLTLMRGVRRQQELVVRAALGAGVSRLRRLLLVENLVLTLMGAALGLGLAFGGMRLLIALTARYSPRASEIHLDLVALAFALLLSVSVALLLSFAAFLPKDGALASFISAGMRMSGGLKKQRLQRALVVTQVAVSVVLLAGAGLLTRTMIRLADVPTGLQTEAILTVPVSLFNSAHYDASTDAENKALYTRMQAELRALPGVTDVALGSTLPLRASMMSLNMKAEGEAPSSTGVAPLNPEVRTVGPDYFRIAGIPLLKGREIQTTDQPGSGKVLLINKALADLLFNGADPIGKQLAFTGDVIRFTPLNYEWRTIVGVVGNTKDAGLDVTPRPAVFLSFAQEMAIDGGFVIRANSNVTSLVTSVQRVIQHIVPTTPIGEVMTVAQVKDQSVAPRRLNAALISLFGILAVVIAAVGIGGVLAFSVSTRTNEIGIRMSLGAASGQVQRMIMREGGVLVALGLVIGIALSFFGGGIIDGLLFGVAPRDPVTLVSVAVTMAVIGIGACWIPAARAARIDPAITMRS